jgi:hypothetical protein
LHGGDYAREEFELNSFIHVTPPSA